MNRRSGMQGPQLLPGPDPPLVRRNHDYWDDWSRHTLLLAERIVDLIKHDPAIRFMRMISGGEKFSNGARV